MAAKAVLALDLGTSTIRALVGTVPSGVLGLAQAPMPQVSPDPSNPLAREFDSNQVFRLTGRLARQALKKAGLRPSAIAAIGITSQRQGVVFLDDAGQELYAGPNMDLRAAMQGAVIDEEMGPELYATTGHLPSLMYAPARLRWFREHHPSTCDRMSGILTIAGWLAYRLTGVQRCEPSLAGEAGLLDVGKRVRCDGLLEKLGLARHMLPSLVEAGVSVGELRPEIARAWELPTDTPVTLAGPDTQSGLVGMQVVAPGMTGLVAGWSCSVQVVTSEPRWDGRRRTWVGCMPIKDRWVAESNMGDGGNAYRWLVTTLLGGPRAYERAERLAAEVPPGSDAALAFLGPGPMSMASAGLRPGGFVFYTPLSFQEVSKGQLLRATLENLAYSARANVEALEEVTGLPTEVIYLGGGLSRSGTFASLLANVLEREVRQSVLSEVSAWGALLAGAVAADEYSSLEEAAKEGACPFRTVESSPHESAEYKEHYQRWTEVYRTIQEAG